MSKRNVSDIIELIDREKKRQGTNISLIASENYSPIEVQLATGSILTNKYAEGYPGKRYYGGCEIIDDIENIAIESLKELFNVKFANVQPHSGASANSAVYKALLKPGDKILGLDLAAGGHLSHGSKFNVSGEYYDSLSYNVSEESETLDYEEILKIAKEFKPQLIICGYSAYPREIDFNKFRKIADSVGAILMADIAHISGLIAAGEHSSPVGIADVITSTTHKTLRGPRGGIIMTDSEEIITKINKGVFPGTQGGPLENVIAGKAICFIMNNSDEYKEYIKQVKLNTKAMAEFFSNNGYRITTGGTDNHLFLVDTFSKSGVTGKIAQEKLIEAGIIVNMNSIPFDKRPTNDPSGIRIGASAFTTMGADLEDSLKLSKIIVDILDNINDNNLLEVSKKWVLETTKRLWEVNGDKYGI